MMNIIHVDSSVKEDSCSTQSKFFDRGDKEREREQESESIGKSRHPSVLCPYITAFQTAM
jgi:hypothetical protein